jgi:nucleotide sugar dehydrogenase
MFKTGKFSKFSDLISLVRKESKPIERPVVCIQGLGHVGSAMAAAVASAKNAQGLPLYNVIGVDLDKKKVDSINIGKLPVACTDSKFAMAVESASETGNLVAVTDPSAFALAEIIVVDVPFDIEDIHGDQKLSFDIFRKAIKSIGCHAKPGALVLVETTVPPGTCHHIVWPDLKLCLKERGLPEDSLLLAHSYERVMPGPNYFESITRFWRVFAGIDKKAGDAAEKFLKTVIYTDEFPLTRLENTTASETAKVLENSYRAVTIAFAEEWGRFAEAVGIDLFEIINAIRVRPTHSNMRQPGFGVGGYCLTKDPLMAKLASKDLFKLSGMEFPFCSSAVEINHAMPLVSLNQIEEELGGLSDKKILLLGVSYRSDVGDTRYSPSEVFVREGRLRGAVIDCHDPLVNIWAELDENLPSKIPSPVNYDAIVFAVNHSEYLEIDFDKWLSGAKPLVFDANCVLSPIQREKAKVAGCVVRCVGRGKTA